MEDWDFYPKWIVKLYNGDFIEEKPLLWRHIPKIVEGRKSPILSLFLDWGNGFIERMPQSDYYYFAYRLSQSLCEPRREHFKVFGYGDHPTNLKTSVWRSDGLCKPDVILDPKPPFLLDIKSCKKYK